MTLQDKWAKGLAGSFLDISSLMENGESLNTKGRGGLYGIVVGLFTCLICRS